MSKIKDINNLYSRYYSNNPALLATVLRHSENVARKALTCAEIKGLDIDRDFVYCASMLHDIGVVKCHAPAILCNGDNNYICHGIEGRKILEKEGLHKIALVCERHTGSGLSKAEIKKNGLPLPLRDMMPITLEEKLICYADKFFSKSGDLDKEKTIEEIQNQLARHGHLVVDRFMELHNTFA